MRISRLHAMIAAMWDSDMPTIRPVRGRKRQPTPHQGEQEKARRVRQMQRGIISGG